MTRPIRVVLADDHPLFRDGVAHSLAAEPDLLVVGQAANAPEAARLALELSPEIALLDVAMPGGGGVTAAAEISAVSPTTRIVMLTVSEDEDDLLAAFKAGARAYILKGVAAGELAHILRSVASGEVYVSPALAGGILLDMTRGRATEPVDSLTGREREILDLLSRGLTNREIGARLHLAEKTVKHHMTSILAKLHVRSRVEAALLAARRGQQPSNEE